MAYTLRALSKTWQNGIKNYMCMSSITKDLIKQSGQISPNQDLLMEKLKKAPTTESVLDQVASHCSIMNSKHLIQALRTLFTLQKHGNSKISTTQILQNTYFEKLCNRLKTQAGMIELNETIEALKVVSYVGVSSNSTIVQVLLQLIRQNINHLTLHQIIFLDFLLTHFKSSPLVDALKIALPLVFEIQLPAKMSRDNMEHIAEYLQYISKRPVSEQCIELIIATGIKCQEPMNARTAKSIIWSLCELEPDIFFEPLLQKAINAMVVDIEILNYNEIETSLAKLIQRYSARHQYYYNEILYDLCGDYVVEQDLGFEKAAFMLKKFSQVNHFHNRLLNYAVHKCYENPELITKGNPIHVNAMVLCSAMTSYRPLPELTKLRKLFLDTDCFTDYNKKDIFWLKLAAAYAALDIYKPEIISKGLNQPYLEQILRKGYTNDYETTLLLKEAVSIFKPDLLECVPSDVFVKQVQTRIRPLSDLPLKGALENGMGGEEYVNSNIKTSVGIYIDHVVALRNSQYPIALNKNIESLEEFEISDDNELICIIGLQYYHYILNSTKLLKGTTSLIFKILEHKGFKIVPICLRSWSELQDYEKIPYLMQKIKDKYNSKVEALTYV